MKEVVMGLYHQYISQVEKKLHQVKPDMLSSFKSDNTKAFNHLIISLDMNEEDIDEPLTDKIYSDPNSPQV